MKTLVETIDALGRLAQVSPGFVWPVAIVLIAVAGVLIAVAGLLLFGRVRFPAGLEVQGAISYLLTIKDRRDQKNLAGQVEDLQRSLADAEDRAGLDVDDLPFLPGAQTEIIYSAASFRVVMSGHVTVDDPNKARDFYFRLRTMAIRGGWKRFELDLTLCSEVGSSAATGLMFALKKHLQRNGLVWHVVLNPATGPVGNQSWKNTLATLLRKALNHESGSWAVSA